MSAPWHTVITGNSTTVTSGIASGTVALPADAAGNTTGLSRKTVMVMGSGVAHIRFLVGTTVGTATVNDTLITSTPKYFNVPGGAAHIAHIAGNAITAVLNIAVAE